MLDLFTILSKSGIVLWYFQGTSDLFVNSVNELIKNIILQERGLNSAWNHNTLSLQYKLDNEFELIFVVAYQNILKLTYIDKFLNEIQLRFRDKYKQVLQNSQFGHNFGDFESDFVNILRECEEEARHSAQVAQKPRSFYESDKSTKTVASMIETKKGFLSNLVSSTNSSSSPSNSSSQNQKTSSKANNNVKQQIEKSDNENDDANEDEAYMSNEDNSASSPSQTDIKGMILNGRGPRQMKKFDKSSKSKTAASPQAGKKGKKATKWEEGDENVVLDYGDKGNKTGDTSEDLTNSQYALKSDVGRYKGDLKSIEVKEVESEEEYDEEEDVRSPLKNNKQNIMNSNKSPNGKKAAAPSGGLFSSFKSLVGSKTLTKEMIEPVMEKMQEHLVAKNVAAEIAKKVCDNVAQNLEGKHIGSFQFVTSIVKQALNESMVQILTPKKRIDILREVYESQRQKKPYVITFCGVNGVGKSTNLAKVTFWLIENSFRVLIAACDTFRSGAVEQLRTHMRHLNALHPPENHNGLTMVELFERGYGKDAASIAHEAISYARDNKIDVVLVDTAGRMQDNEPLMKALAKLININNPDLVLFVGEALVGNEAVDQVKKFNQALIDNSTVKVGETARTIDGIVLTKFDTIDDKVGAAVSMTYTTGQPIVFVGTGQTYSDLKSLNVQSVVQALLK